MEAVTWAALGILAALSLGTLFYTGSRIDALAGRMEARFDAQDGRLDSLAGRMDARFDAMESRLDAISGRIDTHLDQHTR